MRRRRKEGKSSTARSSRRLLAELEMRRRVSTTYVGLQVERMHLLDSERSLLSSSCLAEIKEARAAASPRRQSMRLCITRAALHTTQLLTKG